MKTIWFSFSYKGKNNGVLITQAKDPFEAKENTKHLWPQYDDIQFFTIENIEDENPNLKLDKLYTAEEMIALGYNTSSSYKLSNS